MDFSFALNQKLPRPASPLIRQRVAACEVSVRRTLYLSLNPLPHQSAGQALSCSIVRSAALLVFRHTLLDAWRFVSCIQDLVCRNPAAHSLQRRAAALTVFRHVHLSLPTLLGC